MDVQAFLSNAHSSDSALGDAAAEVLTYLLLEGHAAAGLLSLSCIGRESPPPTRASIKPLASLSIHPSASSHNPPLPSHFSPPLRSLSTAPHHRHRSKPNNTSCATSTTHTHPSPFHNPKPPIRGRTRPPLPLTTHPSAPFQDPTPTTRHGRVLHAPTRYSNPDFHPIPSDIPTTHTPISSASPPDSPLTPGPSTARPPCKRRSTSSDPHTILPSTCLESAAASRLQPPSTPHPHPLTTLAIPRKRRCQRTSSSDNSSHTAAGSLCPAAQAFYHLTRSHPPGADMATKRASSTSARKLPPRLRKPSQGLVRHVPSGQAPAEAARSATVASGQGDVGASRVARHSSSGVPGGADNADRAAVDGRGGAAGQPGWEDGASRENGSEEDSEEDGGAEGEEEEVADGGWAMWGRMYGGMDGMQRPYSLTQVGPCPPPIRIPAVIPFSQPGYQPIFTAPPAPPAEPPPAAPPPPPYHPAMPHSIPLPPIFPTSSLPPHIHPPVPSIASLISHPLPQPLPPTTLLPHLATLPPLPPHQPNCMHPLPPLVYTSFAAAPPILPPLPPAHASQLPFQGHAIPWSLPPNLALPPPKPLPLHSPLFIPNIQMPSASVLSSLLAQLHCSPSAAVVEEVCKKLGPAAMGIFATL